MEGSSRPCTWLSTLFPFWKDLAVLSPSGGSSFSSTKQRLRQSIETYETAELCCARVLMARVLSRDAVIVCIVFAVGSKQQPGCHIICWLACIVANHTTLIVLQNICNTSSQIAVFFWTCSCMLLCGGCWYRRLKVDNLLMIVVLCSILSTIGAAAAGACAWSCKWLAGKRWFSISIDDRADLWSWQ
jgi:hypothetical protein